jgi:succinoglycan biosynthesis transport protein ExoP
MTSEQMLSILWARRRLIAWVFFGVLSVGILATVLWPKSYFAQTSVVIDSRATNPITGAAEPSTQLLTSVVATQMDVIASRAVALKVVDNLHLTALPVFVEKYSRDSGYSGPIREWIADHLLRKLTVSPGKDSSVINIGMANRDPQLAATLANAFANAYMQVSLELKADPARRQSAWFSQQLQDLRQSLQDAQKKLSDFQLRQNIVGTTDQLDVENARLTEISNQLVTAQTAMYESQTRLTQLNQAMRRGQSEEMPDILDNPLLQSLKSELTRAQATLANTFERYGKNHPQYLSASAQVKTLETKLEAELSHVKGAIGQSAEISARQVAELQHSMTEQRSRILELKKQRDQLDLYKGEVDDAQKTYDAAFLRAGEVKLEGQLDQSNIAVLSIAAKPVLPAQPRPLFNILLAALFSVMLSIAVPLLLELASPRVRSRHDLSNALGVPVFCEIPGLHSDERKRLLLPRISVKRLLKMQAAPP